MGAGRPRIPTDDPYLAKRRAQWRAYKARKRGETPDAIEKLPRRGRRPSKPDRPWRRTQIRNVMTGEWVWVTLRENRSSVEQNDALR